MKRPQGIFLLLLASAALIVLILAAVLLTRPAAVPLAALPTAAVLPTLLPRSLATATPVSSAALRLPTAAQTASAAVTAPATALPLSIPQQTDLPAATLTSTPPLVGSPRIGITTSAVPNIPAQSISTSPPPAPPTAPAATPLPTTPANTPRPTPADTIPLGSPAALDAGTLRVLQLYQPADDLLRDLTGAVPTAPNGQRWVVVELLAICSADSPCVPNADAFRLVGSSAEYAPIPLNALQPTFSGAGLTFGQAWGYLTFALPADETALWMQLQLEGRRVVLGLAAA